MVVAMATNRAIGNNNELLWHLPSDLKNFKALTTGKTIIMGRKTYESIGKPLPNRENIVITSNPQAIVHQHADLKMFTNVSDVIQYLEKNNSQAEVMIIGGGQIYQLFLEKYPQAVTKIYLTLVHADLEADVYFPELDNSWQEVSRQQFYKDSKHKFDYDFIELIKSR